MCPLLRGFPLFRESLSKVLLYSLSLHFEIPHSKVSFPPRKRDLWQTHPTLHFCFSATHLHLLMLQFLSSVSYDHSILLDFLVSPETQTFHHLLAEYLEVCVSDWCALVDACEDMGEGRECGVSQGSVIEHDAAESGKWGAIYSCAWPSSPSFYYPTLRIILQFSKSPSFRG